MHQRLDNRDAILQPVSPTSGHYTTVGLAGSAAAKLFYHPVPRGSLLKGNLSIGVHGEPYQKMGKHPPPLPAVRSALQPIRTSQSADCALSNGECLADRVGETGEIFTVPRAALLRPCTRLICRDPLGHAAGIEMLLGDWHEGLAEFIFGLSKNFDADCRNGGWVKRCRSDAVSSKLSLRCIG